MQHPPHLQHVFSKDAVIGRGEEVQRVPTCTRIGHRLSGRAGSENGFRPHRGAGRARATRLPPLGCPHAQDVLNTYHQGVQCHNLHPSSPSGPSSWRQARPHTHAPAVLVVVEDVPSRQAVHVAEQATRARHVKRRGHHLVGQAGNGAAATGMSDARIQTQSEHSEVHCGRQQACSYVVVQLALCHDLCRSPKLPHLEASAPHRELAPVCWDSVDGEAEVRIAHLSGTKRQMWSSSISPV